MFVKLLNFMVSTLTLTVYKWNQMDPNGPFSSICTLSELQTCTGQLDALKYIAHALQRKRSRSDENSRSIHLNPILHVDWGLPILKVDSRDSLGSFRGV